jgi:hypothetical protein
MAEIVSRLVLVVAHPSRRAQGRAPQDEVVARGTMSDPHGEEARSAVSNHEAPELMMAV